MTAYTHLFVHLAMVGWMGAGFWDWICHRRTHIEATSGVAECAFHWLLLGVGGLALGLALFVSPSPGLMGLLFALWLLHQALTWLELRYVVQRRTVTPMEQMVHSFLEMIPLGLIVVITIDVALQGLGRGPWWALRLRPGDTIAPAPVLLAYALAGTLLVLLPFTEEAWRCLRHRQRRSGEGNRQQTP